MSRRAVYPAVFYPWEDGLGYTVEFPDLQGCVSEGETLADAIEMAEDAASGWILGELEEGNDVPASSRIQDVKQDEEGAFVQYITMDIAEYARRNGKKTVRKNLTIPAWLAAKAQEKRINFSQVLQEALIERLEIVR